MIKLFTVQLTDGVAGSLLLFSTTALKAAEAASLNAASIAF